MGKMNFFNVRLRQSLGQGMNYPLAGSLPK